MEYHYNTDLNGAEILKIFVGSGLHTVRNTRVNWPQDDVCVTVCLVTFLKAGRKALLIKQNRRYIQGGTWKSFHAEHDIIEFLGYHIDRIRYVQIFCNFSPCSKPGHECCNSIRKIKEDLKTRGKQWGGARSLTFVFSHLYKIERPSCRGNGCFEPGPNRHSRPQENARSLNNLRSLGRDIRSFKMGDWVALIGLLARWDNCRCGVPTHIQTSFLESFLYGEYGHWRRLEDEHQKRDFKELLASNSINSFAYSQLEESS